MERQGFGKKEATQTWSKMPSLLGSSSQGLVCAQVWGLERGFCCRSPGPVPLPPEGGLPPFSVQCFVLFFATCLAFP